jgi:hypothetical protein
LKEALHLTLDANREADLKAGSVLPDLAIPLVKRFLRCDVLHGRHSFESHEENKVCQF